MIHVAVIGAGATGLCVGRYLAAQSDVFSTVIYEQTSSIGGLWVYNEKSGLDDNGVFIPSKVYSNLRTNLPKQVMCFPDFQFPDDVSSYMTHAQVCKYLEDYADHFCVRNLIQFNTQIVRITPRLWDNTKEQWEVTVKNVITKKQTTSLFDAVVFCIGKVPKTPPLIPGIDQFPGLVMHSHKYRHPETFEGKKVVLLGASASGVDISIDLRNRAHAVYLSHHGDRITCKLPDNLEQHQEMKEVFADGTVLFQDGQKRQADVIIFCTGYNLSFPFLTDDCEITVKDNRITHLYKHLFNIKYPSMSFIGLGRQVCFFPQFTLQARLVLAILSDKAMLPTKEEMFLDEAEEFKEKMSQGNKTHAHFLGPKQWKYNEEVAQLAKCEPVPPIVEKLYNYHWIFKRKDLLGYKTNEFKATSDSTWEDIATIATD